MQFSAPVTWDFTSVDTTPPAAPTLTQPTTPTNQTDLFFSFSSSSSDVASYLCSLDAAVATTCTSPLEVSGLTDGSHTLTVNAVDTAGNVSDPTSVTWVQDTVVNAPVINSGPSDPSSSVDATFTFSGDEAEETFECSLDSATFTSCTSPVSYSSLALGSHSFQVRATDGLGNVATSSLFNWTIAPAPAAIGWTDVGTLPAANSATGDATFDYTVSGASTLTCDLNGDVPTSCTSPVTYTGLADGSYTFTITTDAGTINETSLAYTWTVDTVAPVAPVIDAPSGSVASPDATVTVTPSDINDTLTCTLDSIPVDCATTSLTGLADGMHTYSATETDQAGNGTSSSASWTVDTVSPAPATIDAPSGRVNTTSGTVTVTPDSVSDDLACTLDAVDISCSSLSFSGLADGTHTVVVTETDAAGNVTVTTATWIVDSVAATVSLTSPKFVTGHYVVAFDELVSGVDASSIVLTKAAGLLKASVLSCYDGVGVLTSCGGLVRSVWISPTHSLLPGQHYQVTVNPAGSTDVVDRAGNQTASTATPTRAPVRVQENSVATVAHWQTVTAGRARGGSYTVGRDINASATWQFSGHRVTWYTVTGPTFGRARVLIDGVRKAIVDTYSTHRVFGVAHSYRHLGAGNHVIRIVVDGKTKHRATSSATVAVDALRAGTQKVSATPRTVDTWHMAPSNHAWGGAWAVNDLAGASYTMSFRGTSVALVTMTCSTCGQATIYLDGAKVRTIDLYSPSAVYRVNRAVTGLSDTRHAVKVVVLGTHRSASSGAHVRVDGWRVT